MCFLVFQLSEALHFPIPQSPAVVNHPLDSSQSYLRSTFRGYGSLPSLNFLLTLISALLDTVGCTSEEG